MDPCGVHGGIRQVASDIARHVEVQQASADAASQMEMSLISLRVVQIRPRTLCCPLASPGGCDRRVHPWSPWMPTLSRSSRFSRGYWLCNQGVGRPPQANRDPCLAAACRNEYGGSVAQIRLAVGGRHDCPRIDFPRRVPAQPFASCTYHTNTAFQSCAAEDFQPVVRREAGQHDDKGTVGRCRPAQLDRSPEFLELPLDPDSKESQPERQSLGVQGFVRY